MTAPRDTAPPTVRATGYLFEPPAVYQPAYVVDASIVVKWFSREGDSLHALRLLDDCQTWRRRLIAPSLLAYEVANALRYNANLSPEQVQQALLSLDSLQIATASFGFSALAGICAIARETGLTVYDAVYLALAASEGVLLVTADRLVLDKGKTAGLVISLGNLYGL